MAMLRKPRAVTVILASTAGLCGGLAIFFFVQELDRSGQYSSVLALFVSIIVAGGVLCGASARAVATVRRAGTDDEYRGAPDHRQRRGHRELPRSRFIAPQKEKALTRRGACRVACAAVTHPFRR